MTLNVGDVFLIVNTSLSGRERHYHIVVHKTIEKDIVVVYTTKEVDKARERCQQKEGIKFSHIDPETLVLIEPKDCNTLKKKSAIDCNKAQIMSEDWYTSDFTFKKKKPVINKAKIKEICIAIKKSEIVYDKIKKLL